MRFPVFGKGVIVEYVEPLLTMVFGDGLESTNALPEVEAFISKIVFESEVAGEPGTANAEVWVATVFMMKLVM